MHKKKVLVGNNIRLDLLDLSYQSYETLYAALEDILIFNRNMRLLVRTNLHHDLYHERLGYEQKPLSDFLFIPVKVHIVEKLEKPLFTNVTAMSKIEYDFMLHWIKPLDLFTTLPTLAARVIHRDLLKEKSR